MTIRTQLMLMAAALAPLPLYAQQADTTPAPATTPTAIAPAGLIAPAAQVDRLSVLSYIPAEAESAVFIHTENGLNGAEMSMAVGFTKGNAEPFVRLYNIFALVPAIEMTNDISEEWSEVAKEHLRPVIKDFAEQLSRQCLERSIDYAKDIKLHPVYGAIRFGNSAGTVCKLYADLMNMMEDEAEENDNVECVTHGNLRGLKFTAPADLEEKRTGAKPVMSSEVPGSESPATVDSLPEPMDYDDEPEAAEIIAREGLANRSIYLFFGQDGNHIFCVVCEDPEEIAFPQKPEDSVAATQQWQVVQPHKGSLVAGFSLSPEMNNACRAHEHGLVDWAGNAADLFEKLAGVDAESADIFKAAAAGVRTLVAQAHGMMPPVEKPLFGQVWFAPESNTYHAEMTCDAMGITYKPATFALADKAADPDTIFCCETSPLDIGTRYSIPGLMAVGQAGMDVFNGVVATLNPECQEMVGEGVKEVVRFLPEIAGTCTALGTILDGVGGATGIVVDGKGKAPDYLVDGEDAAMFRIALRTGVKDRAKIAKGWDMLIKTAGDVMEKIGRDREVIDTLPIIPTRLANEIISYNVDLPGILSPEAGANVTLSDTVFVAGSSTTLNQELAATTGTQEFAGTTFVLNLKPLAETARSIADAKLKAAGPITYSGRYLDDEGTGRDLPLDKETLDAWGWDGDCHIGYNIEKPLIVKDDHGVEHQIFWVEENPTEEQLPAIEARDYALETKRWADDVRQIKGDITIKDGIETIHLDIILTPDSNFPDQEF